MVNKLPTKKISGPDVLFYFFWRSLPNNKVTNNFKCT